jgi:hypothetical protein
MGLALVIPALAWVLLDRSVWPWDPAWYGEVSLDLYSALRLQDGWLGSMLAAFGQKAPGVSWLGQLFVPVGGVIGSDTAALLLSIVLTQAATLALMYSAARDAVDDRLAGVAAVLLLASAPLFVGLSHQYFAEPLQTLAVTWTLLVMVHAHRWRAALTIAQLVGATALGLLAKVSTPAYMWAPALVALALAARDARAARRRPAWYRDRLFVVSVVLALPIVAGTLGWYERNGRLAIEHARFAAASEFYGASGSLRVKLSNWLDHLREALLAFPFDVLVALLVVAALVIAGARASRRRRLDVSLVGFYALASAASIFVLLLLFARSANEDVRFLLAALPHTALLLAILVRAVARTWIAVAIVVVLAAHFGIVNAHALGIVDGPKHAYLVAPERDATLTDRLKDVVRASCTKRSSGQVSVVGGDYPWLNGNTLSLLADSEFTVGEPECPYTTLGYFESDVGAAWERVRALAPPYYVSIDYGNARNRLPAALAVHLPSYEPLNRVNRAVFRRILDSGNYMPVAPSRRGGLVVLQRTP